MPKFFKTHFLKSYRDDKDGNVSLMFALSLTATAIFIGAAIDYSLASSNKLKLQNALDATTLYSAKLENPDTFQVDAQAFLSTQIDDLNVNNVTSSFEKQGSDIIGSLSAKADLNFGGFLTKDSLDISAESVVSFTPSEAPAAGGEGGPCIVLLDPNRNSSLTLNSGAVVEANDCEVHVHSTANHAAMINGRLETQRACIAGGVNVNSGGYIENEETQCTPTDDPFAGQIPEPTDMSCDFNGNNYNGGNVTLTPGVYCGWYAFQGNNLNVVMEPGLYVIKNGGWNFNSGEITGHGVTFYFGQSSGMNFNSGIDVDFKAPTSGDYANILMAEPTAQWTSHLNLNDANGYDFEGVLYLPRRNLTLNSNANVESDNLMIVTNSLMVNNLTLTTKSYTNSDSGSDGGANQASLELYISK